MNPHETEMSDSQADFLAKRLAQIAAKRTELKADLAMNSESVDEDDSLRKNIEAGAPVGPGAHLGPAVPESLAIFHTIDGARRIEVVNTPWLAPPEHVDLDTVKEKVIQTPGQAGPAREQRRYDYKQTLRIDGLGLALHLYFERP